MPGTRRQARNSVSLDLCSSCRPPVESIQRRTAHLPLIGSCTDYLAGLLDTFTKYYTYTSASS